MEILQLKYFQHAAKSENISHTAKTFMVPPSSVSVAVKKLEKELGVCLFDRTSNSLKLNENGRIFLRAIDISEREMKKARIDMLNLSTTPKGEIKLLILTNRSVVTDVILKFKKDYPEVSFSIAHDYYGDYASYSKYDVIISDRRIEPEYFDSKLFMHEELLLAVPEGSSFSEYDKVNLKSMKDSKFVCMPKGSSLRDCMDRYFKDVGFEPDIVIECNDPYYVCEYVKNGMGVTLFPGISWKKRIDERFKLLKIEDGIYRDSYMYTNKSSSNIVRMFAETLDLYRNNDL